MVNRVNAAMVRLWGKDIGAISWNDERRFGAFEFTPAFIKSGMLISPYMLRDVSPGIISYPELADETFHGLPGFLADSLPDDFGNAVINAWLARQGRSPGDFNPVERLCYIGKRGMGALEFQPALYKPAEKSIPVEIEELVALASQVLNDREVFAARIGENDKQKKDALNHILSVSTSAGGQRPKAVLAIDPSTGNIVSGQIAAPAGYEYWILKFDGVSANTPPGVIADPQGYGRIEYAYSQMAKDCGIEMTETRLLEENGRAHFMAKRFDRTETGNKLHMLSLCAMAHFDYKKAGFYSYEQAFSVMRQQRLDHSQAVQQFRRMVFNIIARNQDDHTKNIAFLMNRKGEWSLSPAFDITHSYNPEGHWTHAHQMTIGGKRDNFKKQDLETVGKSISIQKPLDIIDEIIETVSRFEAYAKNAGVSKKMRAAIAKNLRLSLR